MENKLKFLQQSSQYEICRWGWQGFKQNFPQKSTRYKRLYNCCTLIVMIGIIYYGISGRLGWAIFDQDKKQSADIAAYINPNQRSNWKSVTKKDIQAFVDRKLFLNLQEKDFDVSAGKRHFRVKTTINAPLQQFILKNLYAPTARYIGIVIMEPDTGRILAMAGYDKTNPGSNPCLNKFPAASVFKIVTTAAAIEKCGFDPDSLIAYSGRKHTLYKSQINLKSKNRANQITLEDSFAQSVNPVFGRIGVQYLGKDTIKEYASAFGFNRKINFEVPITPSTVYLTDEPFELAGIASGFNRDTSISPLHGALMVSAILNKGRLIEPVIIDEITDEARDVIYKGRLTPLNQVVTPDSSKIIHNLMKATIQSGTCRKTFKGCPSDVFSKLNVGGKTGSIDSKGHDTKFDWFVGYAEEKQGKEKIALAIVIGHDRLAGKRSSRYARMIIEEYFRNYRR